MTVNWGCIILKKTAVVFFSFALVAMEPAEQQADVIVIKDETGKSYSLSQAALPLAGFVQGAYNFNRQQGKAQEPIVLDLTQVNFKQEHLGDVIAMLNQLSEPEGPEKVRANLNRIFGQLSHEQLVEEVYIAYYLEARQLVELLMPYIAQKIITLNVPSIEVAQQLRTMPTEVRDQVAQEYINHLRLKTDWEAQRILEGHTGGVKSVAYSPAGKQIVTGSIDETAKIWDAQTGALVCTLTGHINTVNSVAYSPDGKHIVTASGDRTAKIWDAQTGALVHTLTGHTLGVMSAVYSPDGKHIVTASYDGIARIWNAQTGALEHMLNGHTDEVNAAAYSPDGKYIVTGSDDNTARIWYQPAVEAFIAELNAPNVGSVRSDIWSAQQKAAQLQERRAATQHDTAH